jgi:hypothetical protein
VKTTQELMRHMQPKMTMGTYAKGVNEKKRAANQNMIEMVLRKDQKGKLISIGPLWILGIGK